MAVTGFPAASLRRAIWPNRRSPEVFEDLGKAPEYKQKARTARRVWWEYSVGRISKDLMVRKPLLTAAGPVMIDECTSWSRCTVLLLSGCV